MPSDSNTPEGVGFVKDTTEAPKGPEVRIELREPLGAIPAGTRAFLVEDLSEVPEYDHGWKCFLLNERRDLLEKGLDPRWVKLEGRGTLIWTLPKAKLKRVA